MFEYERIRLHTAIMKILTSTLLILLALSAYAFSQDSIGFSFNSDRDNTLMDENTVAGVVPSPGWVSTDGGSDAQGGANGNIEYNGVTVDWSSNGTWNTNNAVSNGDNQLMNGYIDAVGGGGSASVTISGIDTFAFGADYDLYVYFGSDGNGRTGKVALQDGETYSYSTFSQQGGGFPGTYIRTEDTGDGNPEANYALFEGLSGDTQTIDIIRGSNNSGIHGIQIVSVQVFDDDEDGLPDNWEINNDLDPEDNGDQDPNNGPEGDPDQDGLTNIDEFENGTDPQDADTDDDDLNDNVETNTGVYVSPSDTGTNPKLADTDVDGLLDGAEVETGTNPLLEDTDGDKFSDFIEVEAGTDPVDENSFPDVSAIDPPIAYWDFDDQGANETVDLRGDYNATLYGEPEYVTGHSGSASDFAIQFDGIDDYVSSEAPLLNELTEFTMSGWVNFTESQGNRTGLFGQNDLVEFGMISANQMQLWTSTAGAVNVSLGPTSDGWRHIVVKGDAEGQSIYLDGEFAASGSSPVPLPTSGFNFNIGGGGVYDASGNWFIGSIDDVALWDIALSDEAIANLARGVLLPGGPREDSDEDGLPDEWEENNDLDPQDNGDVDPNNGPEGDPDQDGLTNLEEYAAKTSPQDADTDKDGLNDNVETNTGEFVDVTDTGSDPNKADTDGDSLNDGFEVEPNPYVTDPNNIDTDGDRLTDAEEIGNQNNQTDPTKEDTDGGGTSDAVEIALGLDPLNPADDESGGGGGTKIGINFNSDRGTDAELGPDEIAGFPEVAQLNWNNSDGGANAQGGANGSQADIISPVSGVIVDDTGGDSGVTVDWTSNGTWNTNNSFESPDAKLMNGYIDNIGGGGFATVDFQGIPYSSYDVYVYFGSDGNGRTGAVESTTAGQIFSYTTDSQKGGFDPEIDYVLTEDETDSYPPANYCVFKEQSGSDFSVQINRGSSNSGIHGIQIVSLGPGTPFEMTEILYNSETDEFTLIWNSKPNQIYALYVSENLEEWDFDLDDSILSDGDTTTYGPFENPMPGSKQLFFRAQETDEE